MMTGPLDNNISTMNRMEGRCSTTGEGSGRGQSIIGNVITGLTMKSVIE